MADISRLLQFASGSAESIDLSVNNLLVGGLKIGGVLLSSTTIGSAGSTLIGDDNSYSHFTPSSATVKGALMGIDSALAGITISFTIVGSTPNPSGASVAGSVITLQPADSSNPGLLTVGAQSIGGDKTFIGNIVAGILKERTGSTNAVDLINRFLLNSTAIATLDWQNGVLNDSTDSQSADWFIRTLADHFTTDSIDWDNRLLLDFTGANALDYKNRHLIDGAGNNVVTWSGTNSVNVANLLAWTLFAGNNSDVVQAIVQGFSTQTHDLQQWKNFSNTVLAKVDSAGNISATNLSGTNTGDQTITLSGDVSGSGTGAISTTINTHAVSNSKFRQSSALSVVGNASNATADVADISAASDFQILRRNGTAIGFGSIDLSQSNAVGSSILGVANGGTGVSSVTTSPTATAFAGWDANKNLSANNFINGFTSIATSGTTTTLTVGSTGRQTFTGSTTQTVALPVVTTLVNGQQFLITNLSTGVVTVQTSGANSIQAMATNTSLLVTVINTGGGTGTASWSWVYAPAQSSALAISQGGTGQTTASAAFNALSPVTTLGDLIYGSGTNTNARLAGNTSAVKQFLTQTGNGSISAAPVWAAIASADLPTITLTGDVTGAASGGSISTTIASHAVSNSKFRQSSAISVVGNASNATADVADITGTANQVLRIDSAGTTLAFGAINLASGSAVTGILANANTTATSANTASTIVSRDANKNFQVNMVEQGVATTATAAGTTTLTVSSAPFQQFTGTTTQTVVLPDATTLNNGHYFWVLNRSTGTITVKDNGNNTLTTIMGGAELRFVLISNGTSNGTWDTSSSSSLPSTYDTTVTIVTSGGNGSTTINGPISPGTPITLPSSGFYVGAELQVYLNGQLLFLTADWNTSGAGPTFTAVTFVDTLVVGDVVHFVKLRNN